MNHQEKRPQQDATPMRSNDERLQEIAPDANSCSHGDGAVGAAPHAALPAPMQAKSADLLACEADIERYVDASFDAGRALVRIRDRRLYHPTYATFEDYVESRWSFGVRNAQYLMNAAITHDGLAAGGVTELPQNPAQVRPIATDTAEEQRAVWDAAITEYGSASALSQEKVKEVKKRILGTATEATATEATATEVTADWPKEARRALKRIPKKYRTMVANLTVQTAGELDCDIIPELVAEVYEGYAVSSLEDGEDDEAPLVGDAVALAARVRSAPDDDQAGTADQPITDLDVLHQDADGGREATSDLLYTPDLKSGGFFLGTGEKAPLLVSLPISVVPRGLLTDIPGKAKRVIVEMGELERAGGPMRKGVLDVAEVRAAGRSEKIRTTLHITNMLVDWARRTTNPITGCWHSCRKIYCYAAGIATHRFAQGFIPTLYPVRLDAFANTKVPDVLGLTEGEAWRERSVFCASMADLFGAWVPAWYIELVLDEVRQNPEWFVFFLTKHPGRLGDFMFPPNCAVGLTITGNDENGNPLPRDIQERKYRILASHLSKVKGAAFTWISLEPFRSEVYDLSPFFEAGIGMLAMGGQSRTMFDKARQPDYRWVEGVWRQVRDAEVNLFLKDNLTARPKEIPFPAGHPVPVPPKPAKGKSAKGKTSRKSATEDRPAVPGTSGDAPTPELQDGAEDRPAQGGEA